MSKKPTEVFITKVLISDEVYRKAKKFYITQVENNNKYEKNSNEFLIFRNLNLILERL